MKIIYKKQYTTSNISKNFGVITGCDSKQEWLLDWWYGNYKKWNNYPVAFADFGMSDRAKEWCKQKGPLIDTGDLKYKHWFKKPYAMSRVPFSYALWLDLDCEVIKDVLPFLQYAKKGFSAAYDFYNTKWLEENFVKRFHLSQGCINAGIIAYSKNNTVLSSWIKETPKSLDVGNGDQGILNSIQEKYKKEITIISRDILWMLRDKQPQNLKTCVLHWLTSEGKKIIKNKIGDCAKK